MPFQSQEDVEFKGLLKKLVKKTQNDVLDMEDSILKKMRAVSQSRGWNRSSGMKTAPMKLLL